MGGSGLSSLAAIATLITSVLAAIGALATRVFDWLDARAIRKAAENERELEIRRKTDAIKDIVNRGIDNAHSLPDDAISED